MIASNKAVTWGAAWNLMLHRATKKNVLFGNMSALIQIRNNDEYDIECQDVQCWIMLSKYRYAVQLGLVDYNGSTGAVTLRQPLVTREAVDVFSELHHSCTGIGEREFAVSFESIEYRFGMKGNVTDEVAADGQVALKDLDFIVKKKLPSFIKLKEALGDELAPAVAIEGVAADDDAAALSLLDAVVDDAAAHMGDDGDGMDAPNDDDDACVAVVSELHKSIAALKKAGDELVVADAVESYEGDSSDAALDAGIAASLAGVAGSAAPAALCVPSAWEDTARRNAAIATSAATNLPKPTSLFLSFPGLYVILHVVWNWIWTG